MSYSSGYGGGGGGDRRGSGSSGGGYGQGHGQDQGHGYDQGGRRGYDSGYGGGNGGGGYDSRGGGGGNGGGYDSSRGGYDSRGGSGGDYRGGYDSSRGGSGRYESSRAAYSSSGYGKPYSAGGSRDYQSSGGYSIGGGGGGGGGYNSGGYSSSGRYDSGQSYSFGSGGYGDQGQGGYKDERGYGGSNYGGSSSGGNYGRDDRGYGGGNGGHDDRSGSGGYGGGGSGREDRSYGGGNGGGGGYQGGRDDRGGSGGGYGGRDDRSGGYGGRDDRGSGYGGRDEGRSGGYGGDRRDDRRGGRGGGYGGRGGGYGGRGYGGRGGGGVGRGQMGEGAGSVLGAGYDTMGTPVQDPRLVDFWTGRSSSIEVSDTHPEIARDFWICLRPDVSKAGRELQISVNYFNMTLDTNKVKEIFKYHIAVERSNDYKYGVPATDVDVAMTSAETEVKIKPEGGEDVVMVEPPPSSTRGREERPLSKPVVRMVINEMLRVYESEFGGIRVVHDGMAALYSPTRLPWSHKEFTDLNLNGQESTQPSRGGRGPPTFKVAVKEVETIPVSELEEYYRNPEINSQRILQALDVVARHLGAQRLIPVGRNFFSMKKTSLLQAGKELCWGYHQSIRVGEKKLLLNIDQAATVFYAPGSLVDLAVSLSKQRSVRDMERMEARTLRQLNSLLKKLEVVPTHRQDRKRPIYGLSDVSVDNLTMDIKGQQMTVVQYFAERYKMHLKYPSLPAVNIGNKRRPTWLPMEVCDVAAGQRCKNINETDTAEIIRATSKRPKERKNNILDQFHQAGFDNDPYMAAFGMKVSSRLEEVNARMLPTPEVQYSNMSERPNDGAWNLRDKKFVDGVTLSNWGVVIESTAGTDRGSVENFIRSFCDMARKSGLNVQDDRPVLVDGSNRRGVSSEELMTDCYRELEGRSSRSGVPQLMMIIKKDNSVGSYGEIKRVADTVLGIPSQCIVAKNVARANPQYLGNVCLKVNMKLSGKNSVLREQFPLLSECPTIVIGAEVAHPRSGGGHRPSIASVVASLDRYSAKYIARVASQTGNDDIQKLPSMLRDLFMAFYKSTGRKPEKVVYYRDGVSEGQYFDILKTEMRALRRACLMMEDDYCPPVTFIIVNKRHHMRGFGDRDVDRSGNLKPGTVIDTGIVDSHRFDFFLYGHSGIQGTSAPAHYTVLFDENKLSSEDVQKLTYNLCYTYQRCTRSVSVVPPVYYAHLAAARARFFLNEGSDGTSTIGSYNSSASNFEFTDLHKNLLDCMFFV